MTLFMFYLLILFIFLSSCTKGDNMHKLDNSFSETKKISAVNCLDNELLFGRPYCIHYADSSIVIYDDLTDSIFTLIDLKDDNSVFRFGRKGEGSDEFLQVFSLCNLNSDSLIGVYDVFKHTLSEMNLRRVKEGIIHFPVVAKDSLMSINIRPTKYGTYLGLGFYENNMISLMGSCIDSRYFFEYPYQDDQEKAISNRLRGMAYQGTLCSNKSLDKFMYAVRSAPIFMLYSVRDDTVDETYKWIGGYPIYKTEDTDTSRSAPMSAENKQAFVNAYATDKYIYMLYSGKSFKEAGIKAFSGNVIYQMTWNAEPVCKFELDLPIMNFCVSDSDNEIFALADKDEIVLVKYSLQ